MNYYLIFACLIILICLFIIYKLKRKVKEVKITALDNFGKPMELKDAGKRLYYEEGNKFRIITFVPWKDYEKETQASEMVSGVGLMINPKYPNNPVFVRMLFHWRENPGPFPDKIKDYQIKQDGNSGLYYLGVMY